MIRKKERKKESFLSFVSMEWKEVREEGGEKKQVRETTYSRAGRFLNWRSELVVIVGI